jgi:hypothetical protein
VGAVCARLCEVIAVAVVVVAVVVVAIAAISALAAGTRHMSLCARGVWALAPLVRARRHARAPRL